MKSLRFYLYLLIASFLWGSSFVAGKYAFQSFNPIDTTILRFVIASLFVLPSFWIHKKLLKDNAIRKSISLIAFLMIPCTFLLQFYGLSLTSASSAAIIIGFEPLMVNLIGLLFFKEGIRKINIVASVIAVVGITIIMGFPEGITIFGCLLVFLSTIVVAFWIKMSKEVMKKVPSEAFTPFVIFLGTLMLFPFYMFSRIFAPTTPDIGNELTLNSVLAILYLGIACSWIASKLWNKGLENIDSNKSSLFLALEPAFCVLLSVFLLGEQLTLPILIGSILVIAPVIILALIDLLQKKTKLEAIHCSNSN